ncbi:ribosomal protein RPL31 [Toxoplasma gondii TgCatPRC2]|uniref:60s ribosomal protein L31, putative n=15 Tax=Toxoplasma gondii TaxID=5811 RepID=B9Q1A7_TOXGV|nr:ribosomal protein RPL31 [Toxoplasma gondii ME49]5XXB_c Chain c, Ribosomal protein eL31 [Toxoplasma gondii]EPR57302.1 ribosomal protein RPL31 [Toxoplasma gondii GT1]ESS33547.1 ribosomal protein RPL31 [Toxoplasma gondii VEG]KFG32900.1 ribosomal protein RPL31 [Toxoplasma gondii p89]KFG38652.1 ribosomal protein RPL31 [Toxoplasma gondii GAB2-2007-GAL-DOM2]KFG41885.1 ribosomal protein RPL31 [Toxoplasma gondii FOU]KFG56961.1 ribosomal protein RPL31 [Toxoplasma gondii RUB]KFH01521.1 ribosomal pr|eukprot:XP_002368706.1 ribosomal protein RPL31 [Toxoplasma gondii ME49]
MKGTTRKAQNKSLQPVCRDYTIHLHKLIHGIQFKKRAPRALREIRRFAQKTMHTKDVRIDTKLNKFIWSGGIRNVPRRVRVRIARRRNDDEDSKEKFYTLVQHVPVASFENLKTEYVNEE